VYPFPKKIKEEVYPFPKKFKEGVYPFPKKIKEGVYPFPPKKSRKGYTPSFVREGGSSKFFLGRPPLP